MWLAGNKAILLQSSICRGLLLKILQRVRGTAERVGHCGWKAWLALLVLFFFTEMFIEAYESAVEMLVIWRSIQKNQKRVDVWGWGSMRKGCWWKRDIGGRGVDGRKKLKRDISIPPCYCPQQKNINDPRTVLSSNYLVGNGKCRGRKNKNQVVAPAIPGLPHPTNPRFKLSSSGWCTCKMITIPVVDSPPVSLLKLFKFYQTT